MCSCVSANQDSAIKTLAKPLDNGHSGYCNSAVSIISSATSVQSCLDIATSTQFCCTNRSVFRPWSQCATALKLH